MSESATSGLTSGDTPQATSAPVSTTITPARNLTFFSLPLRGDSSPLSELDRRRHKLALNHADVGLRSRNPPETFRHGPLERERTG
jgi:hypothetical protein